MCKIVFQPMYSVILQKDYSRILRHSIIIEKNINLVKTKLMRQRIKIKIWKRIISITHFTDDTNIVIITQSKGDMHRTYYWWNKRDA